MIQGFSSGLIGNRELIYETDLPSFQRDFAALKTLDHGTGPAITFTRASGATFSDANGVLQTAADDAPRFDHDPVTGESRGLLIEESRTNSIRNSQGGGSTNGVIGSGGAAPTNWGITANANGITSEILGTGTEDGFSYIDIKLSGTPTATSDVLVTFEPASAVVAANSQTWTQSAYFKLSGGTTANAQLYVELRARTAGGLFISGQNVDTNFTPTSASLRSQRHNVTLVTSDATVGRMLPLARVSYTSGAAIDITLRIAAPQLELGAFPTSYIPTTTAAATRAADSAIVTPISSFYNQVESTIFSELSATSVAFDSTIIAINDSTQNEQIDQRLAITSVTMRARVGGVNQASMAGVSPVIAPVAGTVYKFVAAYKQDDFAASMDGATVVTDTSGDMPTGLSRMVIGSRVATAFLTGHIRKIAYWPKRLTNTLLEQLTT
jgi:hypothetical protein